MKRGASSNGKASATCWPVQRIYFEATYTVLFSGNPAPTPRYDYNQIIYRLDLADPRVNLPVPVYRVANG